MLIGVSMTIPYRTPEEAKKLLCPIASDSQGERKCMADECMMWNLKPLPTEAFIVTRTADGIVVSGATNSASAPPRKGRCGLCQQD